MSGDCCDNHPCLSECSWIGVERMKSFVGGSQIHSDLGRQMLASSVGSFVTVLALNPLNVIKVRLQKQHTIESKSNTTIRNIITEIFGSSRAIRTFWSGTTSGLMMSVPNTVLYMIAYEQCKMVMNSTIGATFLPAVAGACARACAVSIISPIELVRTLQTAGNGNSIYKILRDIVRKSGLLGLYTGWSSTILRDCPFSAIYWFSLELTRPVFQSWVGNKDHISSSNGYSPLVTFSAGALSGMFAAVVTHPFDVVKTHRQLSSSSLTSGKTIGLRTLIADHGLHGLYRGLSIRFFTVIPASAIMITIYESLR